MGFTVIRPGDEVWEDRPTQAGVIRRAVDVTSTAGLAQSRARLWRYPPGARGRRHRENAQEEVFVVVQGTLTMLLGDPPERVELEPHSVVVVETGTGLQVRNESDEESVVFIYGAPPVTGQSEYLDDVEL